MVNSHHMKKKQDLAKIFNNHLPNGKFSSKDIDDTMIHMFNELLNDHLKTYPDFDISNDDYNGKEDDDFLSLLNKVAIAGGYNDFKVFMNTSESSSPLDETKIKTFNQFLFENYPNDVLEEFVKSINDSLTNDTVIGWSFDNGLLTIELESGQIEYEKPKVDELIKDYQETGSVPVF